MKSAVALVSTSLHEGMPNTFLEAWSLGVPVLTLAFDPDGVVEREGLGISAQGSWERFVSGGRTLWQSRLRREELSARTRAYIESAHSIDRIGARWHALVTTLATGSARRTPLTCRERATTGR
jgi:glycosyltransferase involved in cell wall biosynthesis